MACFFQVYFSENGLPRVVQWVRAHDRGPKWLYGSVNVPHGRIELSITAFRGKGFRADVALDDLTLRKGTCETNSMS